MIGYEAVGNNLLNENVLRHKANLRPIQFYQENLLTVSHNRFAIKGASFFTKHEKKERSLYHDTILASNN
jgi:hypothetical protein